MKKRLKLYLLSQDVNNNYDTYSDCVVAAENEEEARITNPGSLYKWKNESWYFQFNDGSEKKEKDDTWCKPDQVKVELLGDACSSVKKGVICSSFHAG